MIDPHVHLRDWAQAEKETLEHGLSVASSCGIDEVFDMPNTSPPLIHRAAILKRLEDAQKGFPSVRYHLYAGLTQDPEQIQEVVGLCREFPQQVIGLKLFAGHSTGNMGLVGEDTQKSVYHVLSELGYEGVVALHCEKESLLRPELENMQDFSSHSLARPVEAEVVSISDQLEFSRAAHFAGHLHVCHLSSVSSLILVEQAKREGRRVSCAVTPHHVLLSSVDAKHHQLYAKMNPPLRSDQERHALFTALLEGRIDWIESDHAPHTLADKEDGASGIPGFSGLLILVKRLIDAGCPDSLLQELLGKRVQKTFNLEDRSIFIPSYENLDKLSLEASKAYSYDAFALIR
ncbi:MAG: dihydroorotase family protein [Sphaerochaeta sp.]|nr:dihydroorotase family protein [Sphaerochaeta sp.]